MISPTPIGDPGPPGPTGTTTPGGAPPAATAALATTGSQETSSVQNSGSSSYVDKLKVNVNRFERLTRNVLEINLEKDSSVTFINLEAETVAKVLSNLGVDIKTQVEAVQTCPGNSKKIFVWLKPAVNIANFCKEESLRVSSGVRTGLIKPMDRTEVTVLIKGLNLNTPDSLILNYLNLHGKVVSGKVIYDVERSGPLKGLKNGDRKYLVDFTNGVNMSSYHLIDGVKVQVFYPGQRKTCGRCHQTGIKCPGKGFARDCNAERVKLSDYMKDHWKAIKFEPTNFVLAVEEDEDVNHGDVIIKDTPKFTPVKPNPEQTVPDENLTAVALKNLPAQIPEREVRNFLFQHGLKMTQGQLKIVHNDQRNASVDVENIDAATCKLLIANINEKVFFNNKKLYCRALVDMTSPIKASESVENHAAGDTSRAEDAPPNVVVTQSPKSEIPGMTPEELKKNNQKVRMKQKKDAKAKLKENEAKEWQTIEKKGIIPKKQPKKKVAKPDDEKIEDDEEESTPKKLEKMFTFESADLSPKSQDLLSPAIFNSRSAKIIQKEEMWRKSIGSKRELALSPDDERHTRQRCSSTGQGFSEVFSKSDHA